MRQGTVSQVLMRVAVTLLIGVLAGPMAAQAATKVQATQKNGVAHVLGSGFANKAAITWEGIQIGKTIFGALAFYGVLPDDCIGELTIGSSTVDVPVSLCTPVTAGAPAPVAKTAQFQDDSSGGVVTGSDADLKKGVQWPEPRFTDNNNGTITDNLTGLIWLKNADCGGPTYWQGALDFVAGINDGTNDCGDTSKAGSHQADWRLPNVRELASLVDCGFVGPALPTGHPFTNVQASIYWSSTSCAFDPTGFACSVDFNACGVGGYDKLGGEFGDAYYVIAVRGGS